MVDRSTSSRDVLLKILDRARWAPSGDNTQPWRFQIIADDYVIIHGHDTRDEILYDFDGHASHMAHGALLETLRIAASAEGLAASWDIGSGSVGLKQHCTRKEVSFTSPRNGGPCCPRIRTPNREAALTPCLGH